MGKNEVKTKSFESAMDELNIITRKLSDGSTPLDEGIALYQQGLELTKYCMDILSEARGKVTLIKKEFDGALEVPYREGE